MNKNNIKPRVVRVMHVASGDLWAGAEVQLLQLLTAFRVYPTLKLYVVLLNPGELATRLAGAGVNVTIINEKSHGALAIIVRLWKLARQFRPDIIHTHRLKENLIGSIVSLLLPGSISVRTAHGLPEHIRGERILKSLVRWLDVQTGKYLQQNIIAVSHELKGALAPIFGDAHVTCIHNGIDVGAVRAAAAQDVPITLKGDVRIGFVGRLVAVKRVDIFLQVAGIALQRSTLDHRFYVIGDGPLRAELETQALDLNLGERCSFLGFQNNSLPLIAQLDLLVLTSDHEGLPMVVLEALALGVPVVCHATGGLPEAVDSRDRGVLVRDQNPRAYVDGFESTLWSRAVAIRDRPSLLASKFHIDQCARAHWELYCSLLGLTDRA